MANLSTKKWARYEPALPGNAELPAAERFYLEVCAGLSVVELSDVRDGLATKWRELVEAEAADMGAQLAEKLAPAVRLGAVPLTLDGVAIDTLGKYLDVIARQSALPLMRELMDCINHHNSWEGLRALFSVRPFGGTTGTASEKTEPAENQTAAR